MKTYDFIFIIIILVQLLDKVINDDPRDEKFFKKYNGREGYFCHKFGNREYCSCLRKGKKSEVFQFPALAPGCNIEFLKIAYMPMCGNEWYDFIKLCALINFYDDKPFSASNYQKDQNKKFLILLDGCTICPSGDAKITSLSVTHFEKGGNIFSRCSDENEYNALNVNNLDIEVPKGGKVEIKSSSFSLPVILTHRICKEFFGTTEPDNSYTNIYLHITHNCGGREDVKKVLLPDIKFDEKNFKYHVAEIRGLKVNLAKDEVEQYVWNDGDKKYKVNSQLPKVWEDPKVECWWKDTDHCNY